VRGQLELHRGVPAAALERAAASLAATGTGVNGQSWEAGEALLLAARAALMLGRPADAERDARQVVSIAEAAARGPDTSADVGEALLVLAQTEIAQNHQADAQPVLRRAVRCLTNGLGAEHPLTQQALTLAAGNKV
jgi:hypothetical protein